MARRTKYQIVVDEECHRAEGNALRNHQVNIMDLGKISSAVKVAVDALPVGSAREAVAECAKIAATSAVEQCCNWCRPFASKN